MYPPLMELWGVVFGSHMCYTTNLKSPRVNFIKGSRDGFVVQSVLIPSSWCSMATHKSTPGQTRP
jgi:hypothetical protein